MSKISGGLVLFSPVLLATLLAMPVGGALAHAVDRRGSLGARYNFPPPSRGDRFARSGIDLKKGIQGWLRFGAIIKHVALEHHIDPYVLGAYVWVESDFNPRQNYANDDHQAIGLSSVQRAGSPPLFNRTTSRSVGEPCVDRQGIQNQMAPARYGRHRHGRVVPSLAHGPGVACGSYAGCVCAGDCEPLLRPQGNRRPLPAAGRMGQF
jgi:hypothetical protein